MLNQLIIKNLAIVENINLDFKRNLTVLTGETGAGKSIILSSLSLLTGSKSKSSIVRKDCDKADIIGSFDITELEDVKEFLFINDLLESQEECILRRTINKEGKSVCYINDIRVSLNQMKNIGEKLINIHGQHDNQLLLKKKNQILLIDEYINNKSDLIDLKNKYNKWKNLKSKIFEIKNNFEENHAKKELLSYQYKELEELSLVDGEIPLIEKELKTLDAAHLIITNGNKAYNIIEEDEFSISNALNNVINLIRDSNNEIKELQEIENTLNSIQIEIDEVKSTLLNYINKVEINPERLSFLENRLNKIYSLAKKHYETPENLYHFQEKIKSELDKMDSFDCSLEDIEKELIKAKEDYLLLANKISNNRIESSKKMCVDVNIILKSLQLPPNMFSIEFNKNDKEESKYTDMGFDEVLFYIEPNVGEEKKLLSEIASGGELSRISLAIQVIALKNKKTPTMIFDEVDTGVSGEVANTVGDLLSELSINGQVFCITHLPQVASKADSHLYIYKKSINGKTFTQIDTLSNDDRIKEIAQMLGGKNLTKESWEHAKKILEKKIEN